MPADTKADQLIDLQLKALADPTRRKIVELLRSKGSCSCKLVSAEDAGLCVCDLESKLGLTQPTVTHHVQTLRDAGLISTRKLGRWVYCRRDEKALDRLGDWLQAVAGVSAAYTSRAAYNRGFRGRESHGISQSSPVV